MRIVGKLLPVLAAILILGCGETIPSPKEKSPSKKSGKQDILQKQETARYEIRSIRSGEGWGFEIYSGGQLFIRQPHIPAVQGILPFASEEQARDVAALMVYKIKHNVMPPSVTKEEMDSLGIALPM